MINPKSRSIFQLIARRRRPTDTMMFIEWIDGAVSGEMAVHEDIAVALANQIIALAAERQTWLKAQEEAVK